MTDKPTLKPCPFCGGEAVIAQYGTPRQSTIVECTECACKLENGETFRHGSIWNTRAAPKVKALEWEGDGFWSHGPDDGWTEEAITTFGWGYSIEFGREGNFQVDSTFDWSQDGFETPDEAKAAAQADFERRILDALE